MDEDDKLIRNDNTQTMYMGKGIDYQVQCDLCGASVVARNTDDIDRIKHLRTLEDPDELIVCTSCAYNEKTNSAAVCLVREFNMSTIPEIAVISALRESGVPSSVLDDESIVSKLQSLVRNKIFEVHASNYDTQTGQAAAIIHDNTDYSSTQVRKSVINQALLDSGLSANIIQSKNTNDKLLMAELVKIVKQKMKKVESESEQVQVSPPGASVDDYDTQTDQAASVIHGNTDYSSNKVRKSVINQALLDSGLTANIIQSKNTNDKLLMAEFVKIVKQKMKKVESESEQVQVSPPGASVDDYDTQTDQAASIIHANHSSTQVRKSVINQALLDSGLTVNIIQSKNTNDKLLMAELVKIVKQKMKKVESEQVQVSPPGASVDDYDTQTDQAASIIHANHSSTQVRKSAFNQALLDSGLTANIIQSKNTNDKLLMAELVKIVKQKIDVLVGEDASDYLTQSNNAATCIQYTDPNCNPDHVTDEEIDKALVKSGIPVGIIQSSRLRDKYLVNELRSNVKQRMRNTENGRISESIRLANRMECEDERGKGIFQAHVCIACDRHIIGTEEICYLTKAHLEKSIHRLGIESYNEYYHGEYKFPKLHHELVKQYKVEGMEGLLLSQRSQYSHVHGGYEACQSCHDSLKKSSSTKSPPRFAIANGFVIGQIPRVFKIRDKNGIEEEVVVNEGEINDIVRAMLAPTRAYGYTFSYFAGAQQSIQGHYAFYEVDQTLMASVYNRIQESGANPHVHIVLGGRFTPSQKTIVRKKTTVNTKLVTKLLTWFKEESGHKGFENLKIGKECPEPEIEDDDVEEDFEVDNAIEKRFDGGTYYFSSANTPSIDTGVCGTQLKFTKSLLERTPPTLLAYGGDYASRNGLELENIIPASFPWGLGAPNMKRRTQVSPEACLEHYGRLSLEQFMKGDFCLFATHMLDRRLSYTSGKVKCRSNVDGVPLAEKVSLLTVKDLEDVVSGDDTNVIANQLLSSVSVSCKAMGHTSEAAAHWRRIYFALSDRHGLNAFMLTITPNDLASFSVRVIALAGDPVRST